jgi:hypothetical protein
VWKSKTSTDKKSLKGHSLTIIGITTSSNGSINLLVFDPMFHDSSAILKLIDPLVNLTSWEGWKPHTSEVIRERTRERARDRTRDRERGKEKGRLEVMRDKLEKERKKAKTADLLKAYRRGEQYLHKYKEFEILRYEFISPCPFYTPNPAGGGAWVETFHG